MDETKLDPAMLGRLAGALSFVCGADPPATVAARQAADSGSAADMKKARQAFLKLKHGQRQAALTMLTGSDD